METYTDTQVRKTYYRERHITEVTHRHTSTGQGGQRSASASSRQLTPQCSQHIHGPHAQRKRPTIFHQDHRTIAEAVAYATEATQYTHRSCIPITSTPSRNSFIHQVTHITLLPPSSKHQATNINLFLPHLTINSRSCRPPVECQRSAREDGDTKAWREDGDTKARPRPYMLKDISLMTRKHALDSACHEQHHAHSTRTLTSAPRPLFKHPTTQSLAPPQHWQKVPTLQITTPRVLGETRKGD
jgi:hypothetical protein